MDKTKIKILFLSLIFIAVILETIGDVILKKWAIESRNILLLSGLVLYLIGSIFWTISLKYELLSKSISIFIIFNLVTIVLVGIFYFKENLSLINKIGIIIGILSVILMEM